MPSSAHDSAPPGARDFHTTHWSMVLHAQGDTTNAEAALAKLCQVYWYPLYAFVRRQGHGPHDAQDLTQEFFARLLARDWLAGVARERGKFRSWLLASVKHFLANEWDRAKTVKRGGRTTLVSYDSAETRYRDEPADLASPEILFDRRWAHTVLDQVLARLRTEMVAAGRVEQFDAMKFCLTGEKSAYADVARRLEMTEGAVKVAVHRLRDRYRTLLRAEIAETVANPGEVEDELRHLLAALSA